MRICFYASDKPRERELAKAFVRGATQHGHDTDIIPLGQPRRFDEFDAACMVGVKSAELFRAAKAAGVIPIYFDKGYIRARRPDSRVWEYWRVSVGGHQPTLTSLMARKRPHDRLAALELEFQPWRKRGLQIVIAGSSAKYHQFYDLPDPTTYWRGVVSHLRKVSDRPIIYRPKPSWRDAVPIGGTRYSGGNEGIAAALANAHCLITHGSNACFEAVLLGVPSLILGEAVARPISSTSLDDLEALHMGKRIQWAQNLAYHQWTMDEMASGEAWQTIGGFFP